MIDSFSCLLVLFRGLLLLSLKIYINGDDNPLNGGNIQRIGENIPRNGGNIPLNRQTVPLNGGNIPLNGLIIYLNGRDIPLNDENIPLAILKNGLKNKKAGLNPALKLSEFLLFGRTGAARTVQRGNFCADNREIFRFRVFLYPIHIFFGDGHIRKYRFDRTFGQAGVAVDACVGIN
jgi:hypothetical protein